MTREEKIAFCRKTQKETNSNPYIKFELFNETELDRWVAYFKNLSKYQNNEQAK